ncbi:MAG: hypothetical protein AAGA48_18555 [Myxococcota bacterium]
MQTPDQPASTDPHATTEPVASVGPAFAPLSAEIPNAAPSGGTFREEPAPPLQPPSPAPMTTDARVRARLARSPQRVALARLIRHSALWGICALAAVAIAIIGDSLIRTDPPRSAPLVVAEAAPEPILAPPQRQARAQHLVEQADAILRRDPPRAEQTFRDAITLDPTSAAANFGLGVTLLQRKADVEAVPYLCAAHRTATGSLRRDVQRLLDERALDCP